MLLSKWQRRGFLFDICFSNSSDVGGNDDKVHDNKEERQHMGTRKLCCHIDFKRFLLIPFF